MMPTLIRPLRLSAVYCNGEHQLAKGIYLRWTVAPFLGVVGLPPYPLDPGGAGFRLFSGIAAAPETTTLDPRTLFGTLRATHVAELSSAPGWFAFQPALGGPIHLSADLDRGVHAVGVTYRLTPGQTASLTYVVRAPGGATDRRVVDLAFERLPHRDGRPVYLEYTVQVNKLDEEISAIELQSDRPLVLGTLTFGKGADFHRWSPAAGDEVWTPVSAAHLVTPSGADPLVRPVPEGQMLDAVKKFYAACFSCAPSASSPDAVSFERLRLDALLPAAVANLAGAAVGRELVETYVRSQYRQLFEAPDAAGGGSVALHPQDMVALAALNPAQAHLFGLLRLVRDTAGKLRAAAARNEGWFKVQGTWPDGRRMTAWAPYDRTRPLESPVAPSLDVQASKLHRALEDHATWRYHYPIRGTQLRIRQDPPSCTRFFALSVRDGHAAELLSAGAIPSPGKTPQRSTLTHAWERRPKDGTLGVLAGSYTYYVAGIDAFGQVSPVCSAEAKVVPIPLAPGAVARLEVGLGSGPNGEPPVLPVEVPASDDSGHVPVDVSFFFPPEARYVWQRNRATGARSLAGFRPYYLCGVREPAPISCTVASLVGETLSLTLAGVAPGGANEALYRLLAALSVVAATGELSVVESAAALTGGTVFLGSATRIEAVAVDPAAAELTLELGPAAKDLRDKVAAQGWFLGGEQARTDAPFQATLRWNHEARVDGVRLGWSRLGDADIALRKPVIRASELDIRLFVTATSPGPAPGLVRAVADSKRAADFEVTLSGDQRLTRHRRLYLVPLADASLAPGEVRRAEAGRDDLPPAVDPVFEAQRARGFYLVRRGVEHGRVRFGGRAEVIGKEPDGLGGTREILALPDPRHRLWRFDRPAEAFGLLVPVAELRAGREFGPDGLMTCALTVAVEARRTGHDPEVRNAMQETVAQLRLSLHQERPAPTLDVLTHEPEFGIEVPQPDRFGRTFVRLQALYPKEDLTTLLPDDLLYSLYRITGRAIVPDAATEYAKEAGGEFYRRDLGLLIQGLRGTDAIYDPDREDVQRALSAAVAVWPEAVDKTTLLTTPVPLPGAPGAVFVHALKATDRVTGKESERFTALAWPVYVEDGRRPAVPHVTGIRLTARLPQPGPAPSDPPTPATLELVATVARSVLTSDDVSPYDVASEGYVSPADLTPSAYYRGPNLPCLTRRFRVYVTNDPDRATRPVEAAFEAADGGGALQLGSPPVPLNFYADVEPVDVPLDPATIRLTVSRPLHGPSASMDIPELLDLIPTSLYVAVQAEGYLGRRSELVFSPVTLRTE